MRLSINKNRAMSTSNLSKNGSSKPNASSPATKRIVTFAAKAAVATTTVTVSYAAYYYATVVLLAGSALEVNGESLDVMNEMTDKKAVKEEENLSLNKRYYKTDEHYGFEYLGLDTYYGLTSINDDKNTVNSASAVEIVSKAMSAAGLDYETETFINFSNDETGEEEGKGKFMTITPKHHHRSTFSACPSYGCPFLPLDVHYEEKAKKELMNMRNLSEGGSSEEEDSNKSGDQSGLILNSSGSDNAATLTLIGYKGGRLQDQVNQDRAFVLTPYFYRNIGNSKSWEKENKQHIARLLGVFDGHAKFGEKVSEYVVRTLPPLLGSKLVNEIATQAKSDDSGASAVEARDRDIVKILHDTFVELDASAPAHRSGGCTASVVLQLDSKVYVANAGDSRSFIAVHFNSPAVNDADGSEQETVTEIIFATREDVSVNNKPHLGEEQQRVEKMGGSVYLPPGFLTTGKGTTRVMYRDPMSGGMSGLAMSRSIGDWEAGKVGVIPDPLVDILDLKRLKSKVLEKLNSTCSTSDTVEIDPATGEAKEIPNDVDCINYTEKDIRVFAFSATDGLLDYLPEDIIAQHVAKGLYGVSGEDDDETSVGSLHLLSSCEDLIYAAAQGWQDDKGGRYRDDIAIAVADLSVPDYE
ncbi:hypothetical protein ACHAXS_007951 [Conticribra weissflogii]